MCDVCISCSAMCTDRVWIFTFITDEYLVVGLSNNKCSCKRGKLLDVCIVLCRGLSVGLVHAQIVRKSILVDGNVCGVHIGGTRSEVSGKNSRPNHPAAVLVYKTTNENAFSVQTSTRDDRCFVVQECNTFLCCHTQCKTSRATFVSSNLTNNFSCSHTKKCKDAVAPDCVLELSNERTEQYQADSSTK